METAAAGPSSTADGHHDLFISYSRRDKEFVQRLSEALADRDRSAWVDWQDIPPIAEWMSEIKAAIEAADTFVLVISPESIASKTCSQEISHALEHNKRIIPVLRNEVDPAQVSHGIASLNWVLCRDEDDFDAACDTLISAIDTDLEWVHAHTRLLVKAREWEGRGRAKNTLSRGDDLAAAERMLSGGAGKQPLPTPLQTAYVIASRQAATTRQRGVVSVVAVALAIAVGLAFFAWAQRGEALRQRTAAITQRNTALSRELAGAALSQLEVDTQLSLLLSVKAASYAPTTEAVGALRRSLLNSPGPIVLQGHEDEISTAQFSPDGDLVVTASWDGTARIWQADSGKKLRVLDGHTAGVITADFSPDATLVVTSSEDGTARVWETSTGKLLRVFRAHTDLIGSAAFSPDGELVVTASDDGTARIWQAATGRTTQILRGHAGEVWSAAFSPDGGLVVTTGEDGTAQIWEAVSGRHLRTLRGHKDTVGWAVFSPDGERVVTSSLDATARVWDVATGKSLLTFRKHTGWVFGAEFSPDGKLVSTAGDDDTARIWDASTGSN